MIAALKIDLRDCEKFIRHFPELPWIIVAVRRSEGRIIFPIGKIIGRRASLSVAIDDTNDMIPEPGEIITIIHENAIE